MPVKKETEKQHPIDGSSVGRLEQYHFLQLRVGQQALEGQVYGGEQLDLEISSYLQSGWTILSVSTHTVPIQPGQPFAGWYCVYHFAK